MTRSFVIMTTTPNAEMAELHDRMPVVVEKEDWPTWLGEVEGDTWRYYALRRMGCCAHGRSIGASDHRGTTGRSCRRASQRRRRRRGGKRARESDNPILSDASVCLDMEMANASHGAPHGDTACGGTACGRPRRSSAAGR